MLGAMILHLFVLSTGPFAAVVPAILLVFVIAVGWKGRGDTTTPYIRIQIQVRHLGKPLDGPSSTTTNVEDGITLAGLDVF